jgi:conjugative transfer region protein TrbK
LVPTAAVLVSVGIAVARAEEKAAPPIDDAAHQKELERCSKLSIDLRLTDAACEAAARANERRFLGAAPVYTPVPVNPFPGVPQPKLSPPKSDAGSAGQQ